MTLKLIAIDYLYAFSKPLDENKPYFDQNICF